MNKREIEELITKLHNDGYRHANEQPSFNEPSYLAACMSCLEFFKATTQAPSIWIFGPMTGCTAFGEKRDESPAGKPTRTRDQTQMK